jgi:hypothetical protein
MIRNSILTIVVLLALAVAACSPAATNDIASLDSTTTSAVGSDDGVDSLDAEEAMLALTQCLRDGGIDIDDPIIDENGNPQLPPFSFETGGPGNDADPEAEMKAMEGILESCQHHLDGVVFDGTPQGNMVDMEDTFVAYAQCMRDHGIDMPDPDFGDDGFIDLGTLDAGDEEYEAAHATCKEVFTGSGIDLL